MEAPAFMRGDAEGFVRSGCPTHPFRSDEWDRGGLDLRSILRCRSVNIVILPLIPTEGMSGAPAEGFQLPTAYSAMA